MMRPSLCGALLLISVATAVVLCTAVDIGLERRLNQRLQEARRAEGGRGYSYNTPLLGNEERIGEYYISLAFGTPPQHFTVQVDTGSADIAVPALGCGAGCGRHPDPPYNPTHSNTSAVVECSGVGMNGEGLYCPRCSEEECNYRLQYLDGSYFTATLYSDEVTIGGMAAPQVFGAITSESTSYGQFEPYPIDGIAGFAYSKVSEVFAPNIIDTLSGAGYIDDIFSMCLTDDGGMMTLGGIGNYYSGEIQYTPITKEAFYAVEMTDLTIWNQTVGVDPSVYNSGQCIVDSGTTLMYLPVPAWTALADLFQSNCGKHNLKGVCYGGDIFKGECVSLTQAELDAYPTIDVHLAPGIVLPVSPEYYLPKGYCWNDERSLGIGPESESYGTLLGDVFMKNFLTVFDRENARMGFAPVHNCPSQSD